MPKGIHWIPACMLMRDPQATRNSREKNFNRRSQVQPHGSRTIRFSILKQDRQCMPFRSQQCCTSHAKKEPCNPSFTSANQKAEDGMEESGEKVEVGQATYLSIKSQEGVDYATFIMA